MPRARRTNCCGSTTSTTNSSSLTTITSCPDSTDLLTIRRSGTNYYIPYNDFISCNTCSGCSVQATISIAFPEKPYDYTIWAASTINANETIFKANVRRAITVPLNLNGWRATLDTAPTSAIAFPIFKVAPTTVTLTRASFAANSKVGSFSSVALTSIGASAQYIVKAPSNLYSAKGLALTMLHTVRVSGTFTGQGSQSATSVDLTSVGARITSVNSKVVSINAVLSAYENRLSTVSALVVLSGTSGGTFGAALTSIRTEISNLSVDFTLDVLALETLINSAILKTNQVSAEIAIRNFAKLNAAATGSIVNSRGISSVTRTTVGTYAVALSVTLASAGYYVSPAIHSVARGIAIDTRTSTSFRIRTFDTSTGALVNAPFTLVVSR